jgi:hypothetical protein
VSSGRGEVSDRLVEVRRTEQTNRIGCMVSNRKVHNELLLTRSTFSKQITHSFVYSFQHLFLFFSFVLVCVELISLISH